MTLGEIKNFYNWILQVHPNERFLFDQINHLRKEFIHLNNEYEIPKSELYGCFVYKINYAELNDFSKFWKTYQREIKINDVIND